MAADDPSLRERRVTFEVDAERAGQRLDKLLVQHVPELGRAGARELIRTGAVRVDGRRARKGQPVATGAKIELVLPPAELLPEPAAPLDVRWQGDHAVVVYKQPGQPTAPLSTRERGTLAGALLGRFPEMQRVGYGPREPGLLHRLDTHTEGLLLAARSAPAFDALRRAMDQGLLRKRYRALVETADAESGEVDCALEPDPRDRKRVSATEGRAASPTRWRVVRRTAAGAALVEADVSRAYRHQVRAHLAHAGMSIVGDVLYGAHRDETFADGFALQASYIAWAGDGTLDGFEVEADLPERWRRWLDAGD